ncbi:MAG TPA: regulatory iron-sulfur-containing complex subunit RicT [Chitinophagaceae bacterium]|nr:regulatory iron-sulfur-containing complex subunit RicT [Chitinophagaceae bacterium]
MGCGSCGTGKPNGCKSNGGCSTGGCNRLNVHDWLMNLPISDTESSCKIVEVSFNNGSRKDFYRNATLQHFEKGEYVTIEGVSGFDVGEVSLTGELVRIQMKKKNVDEFNPDIKKILRRSTDKDLEIWKHNKSREKAGLMKSREIALELNLQMKLTELEIQADGKKATFFYTADDRVDFRELIKRYASEFRVKVEMRQIGIRQEAGKVGGIGSCGRELCCSTWLTDFKSVTTTAARYQNLSINQTKLSGQCGRLKCCLNYELDTYLDALQNFPDNADMLDTTKGTATLIKKDIFKNLMWYVLPESSKQYPLSITRVREIKKLNFRGERVDELQPVELVSSKPSEMEHNFVDVVGQISLKSLEKDSRRRNEQRGGGGDNQRNQQQQKQNNNQRGGGQKQPQRPPLQGNQGQQRPPKQRPTFNKPPQRPGPDKKQP